jgi:hypothetical protein
MLSGRIPASLNLIVRCSHMSNSSPKLEPPELPRPRPLLYAGYIVVAWIACLLIGAGSSLAGSMFGCRGPEVGGGHGFCALFDGFGGLALLAAFGAPLFILGVVGCLGWAALRWVFGLSRRR